MIVPFKYRLGLELACDAVKGVLVESTQGSCTLMGALERGRDQSGEGSEESDLDLLSALAPVVPNQNGMIPTSLILPADRIIESSIKVPKGLGVPREDWECWELSMHLSDSPGDYWYESSHAGDSVCGRFHIRRIFAVRKQFVQGIFDKAAKLNLFIDKLFFPQSIWAHIVRSYGPSDGSTTFECIYLDTRLSYFMRVSGGTVMDTSPVRLSADGDIRRFVETVATLLSWHGGESPSGARRIIMDGGGSTEIGSALTSRLGFSMLDSQRFSKLLHGGIDRPEHFLLPLAALGVI